jgi:hypothetical protein
MLLAPGKGPATQATAASPAGSTARAGALSEPMPGLEAKAIGPDHTGEAA